MIGQRATPSMNYIGLSETLIDAESCRQAAGADDRRGSGGKDLSDPNWAPLDARRTGPKKGAEHESAGS